MTDLKLIDELLCDLRQSLCLKPEQVEWHSSIAGAAIRRLREAYKSGEMPVITATWVKMFEAET